MSREQPNQAQGFRRTESKDVRRRQLIESTIECLASGGYAGITMAKVAAGAGLSTGLVNFHFSSKDLLLSETLNFLNQEYTANWQKAVAEAGPSPVDQLSAWIRADFSPPVCTPQRLVASHVLWTEPRALSNYMLQVGRDDRDRLAAAEEIHTRIVSDCGYLNRDPRMIASGLEAMMDGLWLDLMMDRQNFDTAAAARVVFAHLHTLYPYHFGPNEGLSG